MRKPIQPPLPVTERYGISLNKEETTMLLDAIEHVFYESNDTPKKIEERALKIINKLKNHLKRRDN